MTLKRNMIYSFIGSTFALVGGTATASTHSGSNATIKFFTVSGNPHAMIETQDKIWNDDANPGHPWCKGRFYIHSTDALILKQAMAASLAGKKVNFLYEDNASEITFAGHSKSKCMIISVWF